MTRLVTVTAERGTNWWVLECMEAGSVSQVRRLSQAADEMREAIAHQFGVAESDLVIDVVPILPAGAADEIAAARASRLVADEAIADAARHARAAARLLADSGLSMRDVGVVMGVSHQRVAQLLG